MSRPTIDDAPRRSSTRWLSSIRLRTFGLLVVVLGTMTAAHVLGLRAFEQFTQLGASQELISDQAARVQEIELRLVRTMNGTQPVQELEASLEQFDATLHVLCTGGTITLGNRAIVCTPPGDAESAKNLNHIRDSWTSQRESIHAVLAASTQRAEACAAIQNDTAPFLAVLSALEQQLENAKLSDEAELAADTRKWGVRLQTAASQLLAHLGGDELDQAALAMTLANDKLRTSLAAFRDGSEELELDALGDAAQREKLTQAVQAYIPLGKQTLQAVASAKALAQSLAEVSQRSAVMRQLQSELWVKNGTRTAGELARYQRLQLWVLVGVAAMILLFGAYLQVALLRPILRLRDVLTDIAGGHGDLTQTLAVDRRDEIGDVAARFNEFTAKLRELVREIAVSVEGLAASSSEVKAISARMSEGVELTEDRAQQVFEGIGAIDQDFTTVVEGAQGVERSGTDIRASCVETNQEVQRSVELSGAVRKDIDELALAAGGIGDVLTAIEEISLRVKMLSINAAIEAAHAGDAGRGFAVVASEVKTLSAQTQEQTAQIDATIRGLIEVCDRSNRSFQSVDDSILRIQARQVSACRAADDQVEASTRMRESLGRTQAASASVRKSAEEMRTFVRGASEAALSTRSAAGNLDQLSSNLKTMLTQFRY